jgi:hypothetical protein
LCAHLGDLHVAGRCGAYGFRHHAGATAEQHDHYNTWHIDVHVALRPASMNAPITYCIRPPFRREVAVIPEKAAMGFAACP